MTSPIGQCAICVTEILDGEAFRTLPCAHKFHELCMDPWLKEHNTCPICRHEVISIPSTASISDTSASISDDDEMGIISAAAYELQRALDAARPRFRTGLEVLDENMRLMNQQIAATIAIRRTLRSSKSSSSCTIS